MSLLSQCSFRLLKSSHQQRRRGGSMSPDPKTPSVKIPAESLLSGGFPNLYIKLMYESVFDFVGFVI